MSGANLYAAIAQANARRSEAIALETEDGAQYRYGDLDAWSARYANLMVGLGLAPGDRVAVQTEKSHHALFFYLACLRAGLVYVPLNTAYQRSELEYFLQDAEPRLVVGQIGREGQLAELLRASSASRLLTLDETGTGSLREAAETCAAHFDTVGVAPDQLAVIIYTSGTTGRPKGAMVTHRNLLSNALALIRSWGFTDRDVLLHALPMFHVHGLFVANHCALLSGAKMLWRRKFDPRAALRDLPRATVFMGVPTYYTRLLAESEFGRAQCSGMRLFISGSAPLLPDTFGQFEARAGLRILERYGMSEAGMIASNPLSGERRPGTVGFPLPGVSVRVADAEDRVLPVGAAGMIQVKGDNVFAGYWRRPEATRQEFTSDGWFRTGDIGSFDRDGYLSIVGRAKDLIISGGYNVYPREVESVLERLPGVAESAVVGVPHPDFGEAVTAVVVAVPGAVLNENEIIAALKSQLANYKVPKRVFIVAELPRNAMGKVQKNLLRELFARA
ncbi:MAG TPA: malonyl-CoA synthase [Burkholderiales bacterium]|jgi:malonyl-CoA/methylmalonyl-CoA synthetase|nr:malonyl-CoA synthase [Burkholderiales bacterium]